MENNIYSITDELNKMITSGDVVVDYCHSVFGAKAYHTANGCASVLCKQGKFYGGGISDYTYTVLKDDVVIEATHDALRARELFYNLITS